MYRSSSNSAIIVLTVLLVFALLAGCSQQGTTATTGSTTTKATTKATTAGTTTLAPEEPLKFTMMQETHIDLSTPIWQELQEKLNIEIDIINAEGNYSQKVNILYAANDLPDVFQTYMIPDLRKNSVVRIPFDEFFAAAPLSYQNTLDAMQRLNYDPEKTWKMYMPEDGLIGELPMIWYGASLGYGILWRQDYLEELGYSEPPTTIDGYTEVFAAYKEKYPDRYAYSSGNNWYRANTIPIGAAGAVISRWMLEDGKLVPGWTRPGLKDALIVLKDWYDKGYLDREFLTKTDDFDGNKSFENGITIVKGWSGEGDAAAIQMAKEGKADISPRAALYSLNPDAELVLSPWPTLHDGVKPACHAWASFHGNAVGFNRKLENDKEKLIRLIGAYDRLTQEPENVTLFAWGEQDVDWEVGENGMAVSLLEPAAASARGLIGFGGNPLGAAFRPMEMELPFMSPYIADAINEIWTKPSGIYSNENVYRVQNFVSNLIDDDSGINLGEKYADLMLVRETLFAEIVVGVKSIDEFDRYVELWNTKGGKEIEELVNRKYLDFYK